MVTAAVHSNRMSLLHAIAVGAAVLGFLFVLCWAGEALGFVPATHRFVSIFTGTTEGSTSEALVKGLPWAIGIGALTGALVAVFSNLFQFLDRR